MVLVYLVTAGLPALAPAADVRITDTIDPMDVKPEKQTLLQLYVRAADAVGYLRWHRDMLLVDVRPSSEVQRGGVAAPTAASIPFLIEAPDAASAMTINAGFEAEIRTLAAARGLEPRSATLLLICSYGILSSRAADLLAEAGFANVYTVIDGFDGDPSPEGIARMNGWRTLGLPTVPHVHRQPRPREPRP